MLVFLRLRKNPELSTEEVQEDEPGEEERPFELKDISIVFPEGALSVVCGPTGSGKSSRKLLLAYITFANRPYYLGL
jgi:ABC-type lipoprotein export system ATPase subunit